MKEKKVNEISTTDPDARMMAVNNNGLNVCYNVQTAVDQKNKLIVDYEVINNPTDHGQLSVMGQKAKEILGVDEIKALADKGYYSSHDLKECDDKDIEAYVAKQKQAGGGKDPEFYPDRFQYNQDQNTYACPAGQTLYPSRIRKIKDVEYQEYNNFCVCKTCEFKERCTSSEKGRTILRNVDQALLNEVDKRTRENKELYAQRQMIVEHPYGTIKGIWGYSYFLTRGLLSVNTESALSFLAYNLRRAINILGVVKMVKRLAPA
ncbi:MAG: transposase [Paludibacter sp.]|nr:transposase [Paludibacter sp.]